DVLNAPAGIQDSLLGTKRSLTDASAAQSYNRNAVPIIKAGRFPRTDRYRRSTLIFLPTQGLRGRAWRTPLGSERALACRFASSAWSPLRSGRLFGHDSTPDSWNVFDDAHRADALSDGRTGWSGRMSGFRSYPV